MSRSRILLVEDDPSITRFVMAALEELPVDVAACQSMEEAWRLLNESPVALVISDLMLPVGSGLDLLHQMRSSSVCALQAIPVIVLSAGLNADVLRELESAGVFRALLKPVSVSVLESCVSEALRGGRAAAESVMPAPPTASGEQQAIATYFAGDHVLFQAYKASCLAQFDNDVEQGDAAMREGDAYSLRRVAHNCKSVLLTLGYAEGSELARGLENSAAHDEMAEAAAAWGLLRECLSSIKRSSNTAAAEGLGG